MACVPSPPGWDAYAAGSGFTGEKKDGLGRRVCYHGGRRITAPARMAEGGPCKPGERADLTGCTPEGGSGGGTPSTPGETPVAREHAARQTARETRRDAAGRVDALVAAGKARHDAVARDPDAARASVSGLASGLRDALSGGGATDAELAGLDDVAARQSKAVERHAARAARLGERHAPLAAKAAETAAAYEAAQAAHEAHQAAAPDPPPDDAPDDIQATFDDAQAAWEKADEKLQAAEEKAAERDDVAQARADDAAGPLGDALDELENATEDAHDALAEKADEVQAALYERIDAEEEADPPPEDQPP